MTDEAIRFSFGAKTINPKSRAEHWATRAKRTKVLRHQGMMQALSSGATQLEGRHWTWCSDGLTVLMCRLAPSSGLDDDNLQLALSPVRDGVADALGVDDRDPRVTWRYDQRRGPYAVEVTIERREA